MVETVEIGYLGLSLKSKWQGYHQGQDSGYLRTLMGASCRISQKATSWALLDSGAPKNSLGIAPVRLQLPGHQPHTNSGAWHRLCPGFEGTQPGDTFSKDGE